MHKGDPVKLNFEGPEMQKWNIPTDTWKRWEHEKDEKWGDMSSYRD